MLHGEKTSPRVDHHAYDVLKDIYAKSYLADPFLRTVKEDHFTEFLEPSSLQSLPFVFYIEANSPSSQIDMRIALGAEKIMRILNDKV